MIREGVIRRINGSLIIAEGLPDAKIGDVAYIGGQRLIGEVVKISGNEVDLQCYEDTSGLRPGEPVVNTGKPLVAELGPGLVGEIFDGLERSELELWRLTGPFIKKGYRIAPLRRDKKWHFIPRIKVGDRVTEGDILGIVRETSVVEHRILTPVGINGVVERIEEGDFRVEEPIAEIRLPSGEKREITMVQVWPVRIPRPYKRRLPVTDPLFTGQRVIDMFFPVAKGGTAAIPGGFGSGKTITLHQIAKWSDADIVIYIGCGERGNEMAEVITNFPQLEDPRTGKKLIERAIFIANVSNLPVSAREASVYMGVTIAEYLRDQGYHVAVIIDSTSRWAEALRDLSGRLEEIPAEEGYPAYLAERIAGIYERAGKVVALGGADRVGSVTIMGAVSPPGGDFSEPVTSTTIRYVGSLWALDTELAYRRHFPAINWLRSFTKYVGLLDEFWGRYDPNWKIYRERALEVLEEASRLEEIARVIGEKALPDEQRLILLVSEIIREGYLVQHAFHEVDTYCPPEKQVEILKVIIGFYDLARPLIEAGVPVDRLRELRSVMELLRLKEKKTLEEIMEDSARLKTELESLKAEYEVKAA
ncbi:MAG: V-type ATP synthase subunit A [Aigarchaeota archaeon]|nr:V-type ATP synthase subunit A [Aigarchaeota archaeon]MDW8021585.1 V-type ATP synthase subunit A [Nitrososphaerota archaeon]